APAGNSRRRYPADAVLHGGRAAACPGKVPRAALSPIDGRRAARAARVRGRRAPHAPHARDTRVSRHLRYAASHIRARTMKHSREEICASTSSKLRAAVPTLKNLPATVGLDGFVDEIVAVVDKRQDNVRYEPVRSIGQLGTKILNAAGQSSNY